LRQKSHQRRGRFIGGDPRTGIVQILFGASAAIGAARAGLWVLAGACVVYVISLLWGARLWKQPASI